MTALKYSWNSIPSWSIIFQTNLAFSIKILALRFVFVFWLFISGLFFHSIWTWIIYWLFLFSGTCFSHFFISSNFVRLYLFLEAIEILLLTSPSSSSSPYVSLIIFWSLGLCLISGPSMMKSPSSLATSASSTPSPKDWRWLIISPRGGWLWPCRVHWSQSYILKQIKFS